MGTTKRLIHIFGGLIQLLLGIAVLFAAGATFYNWVISRAYDAVLSVTMINLVGLTGWSETALAVVTPIAFLLFGLALVFTATDLMSSPYTDKTKKHCREKRFLSVLSALLDGTACVFIFKNMFNDDTAKFARFACILFLLLAAAELTTAFLSYTKHLDKKRFATDIDEQKDDSVQTTVNAEEFNERAALLRKLYVKGKINENTLKKGLSILMSLPVDMPLEFKLKHLDTFTKKKLLSANDLPFYVCKAVIAPCSSSTKERLKYVESLRAKGVVNEDAFNFIVEKLMGPAPQTAPSQTNR